MVGKRRMSFAIEMVALGGSTVMFVVSLRDLLKITYLIAATPLLKMQEA